ncbi:endo alpha-1,4 polygalactosaminidase [Actinoallomurus sp. NBC_01490]|uniref:endo alpha-1,4 polygalactosaminidase n=1 Tax=Actinoallomurus sp. NBC_01490 TaxID=2903557 RepID=UPI002E36EA17|nr:endo alpha-1,4 polygalactosaminidase [Actinoallomurus sp. NBC_01490]
MRPRRVALVTGAAVIVVAAVVAVVLVRTSSSTTGDAKPSRPVRVTPPPASAAFDYQIGGPYPPAPGVRVVSRDRSAAPLAGHYNVCYVNAFQAQPDELAWWRRAHPDLLLRKADGAPVIDQDWNEALLDVSTPDRRAAAAAIVGAWIDGCARRGFQAVEPDNLDSYERSGGRLTPGDNVAFAALLARRAHADGLAIGQKNTAGLLSRRQSIGFDFAVAEECGRYDECDRYASAYPGRVFDIEYRERDLKAACRDRDGRLSVVLRDRDVSPPGDPSHRFATC